MLIFKQTNLVTQTTCNVILVFRINYVISITRRNDKELTYRFASIRALSTLVAQCMTSRKCGSIIIFKATLILRKKSDTTDGNAFECSKLNIFRYIQSG